MLSERDQSFFAPLWRRVAVIVFCFVWAGWELYNGEDMWAFMVGAIGAYGIYIFIFRFDEEEAKRIAKAERAKKRKDPSSDGE